MDGDVGVQLAIVPADRDHERRFDGNCWQAALNDPDVADDAPRDWGHGEERTRTLDAGERIEGTYYLVATWTSCCVQRGDYLFDRRYALDGQAYEWAFRLHVPSYSRET